MLAHLSGTICLKHSATLILPPLLKPPLFLNCFSQPCLSPRPTFCVCVCDVCVCVCVVSVIVKRPVLPPCMVDGRSRNPLYYYYYYYYYYYLRVSAPCQATVCPVVGPVLEMTVGGPRLCPWLHHCVKPVPARRPFVVLLYTMAALYLHSFTVGLVTLLTD